MPLKIGIHTGPQNLSMDDLRRLWQKADDAGLHWASVWDHFYANPLRERSDPCFEGVASMAAGVAIGFILSERSGLILLQEKRY